jgi:hypothetical protein
MFTHGTVVLLAIIIGPNASVATRQPPAELESWWAALSTEDPVKAHQAMTALVAKAAQTVPFLEKRLRPVPRADPGRLAGLIDDLDSSQFPVRQRATQELERLGEPAGPALRQALTGQPSPELRRRVEQVLEAHKTQRLHPSPGQRQLARAIEVLERIGSGEARRLLAVLAQGAPEAAVTRDAQGALDRLAKRLPVIPGTLRDVAGHFIRGGILGGRSTLCCPTLFVADRLSSSTRECIRPVPRERSATLFFPRIRKKIHPPRYAATFSLPSRDKRWLASQTP